MEQNEHDDSFTLYDLRVEVIGSDRPIVCSHAVGEYFEVSGENLKFTNTHTFSFYTLAALIPLFAAKQRETHPNDWMTTDMYIACPDPHCGGLFRITRTGKATFKHSEVTKVPLKK